MLPLNMPKGGGNRERGSAAGSNAFVASSDASLFSSSLPILPHEKLNFNGVDLGRQSVDDISSDLSKAQGVEHKDVFEDVESHAIGNLLPDDEDELLAGLMDDFDLSGLLASLEDFEDYDLFGSGGGMELEGEPQEGLSASIPRVGLSDGVVGNGIPQYGIPNGVGTLAGEHLYGEHPSRTLFVRNINSNVEDTELRALFEQYGDIRTLYTACKRRGFVMIFIMMYVLLELLCWHYRTSHYGGENLTFISLFYILPFSLYSDAVILYSIYILKTKIYCLEDFGYQEWRLLFF